LALPLRRASPLPLQQARALRRLQAFRRAAARAPAVPEARSPLQRVPATLEPALDRQALQPLAALQRPQLAAAVEARLPAQPAPQAQPARQAAAQRSRSRPATPCR
jgi:hypothetical protein